MGNKQTGCRKSCNPFAMEREQQRIGGKKINRVSQPTDANQKREEKRIIIMESYTMHTLISATNGKEQPETEGGGGISFGIIRRCEDMYVL